VDPEFKDEIDFRDLIRKPEKLFGYSFFYFVAVLLLLGMIYLWNIDSVGRNAIAPVALKDSSAFVLDIPLQSPATLPPVEVMKLGVPSDSLVARGRDLFRSSCTPCHGETGLGDGPTAASLNPRPRNFHVLTGWTNGSKVSQIYKTLQEGIIKNGMASYGYIPPADRFALAHYVRTFVAGQPADSREDLQALETAYQLSKGSDVPGQVPIKKATQIILAEKAGEVAWVNMLVGRASRDNEPGAAVLRAVAADLKKVVAGLVSRTAGMPPIDEFVRSISADPLLAGFKPAVNRLATGQWLLLYSYLNGLVRQVRAEG
jgi:mono/diheme cytochrome c family protein